MILINNQWIELLKMWFHANKFIIIVSLCWSLYSIFIPITIILATFPDVWQIMKIYKETKNER